MPFPVQCAFLGGCGLKILKAGFAFMVTKQDVIELAANLGSNANWGELSRTVLPVLCMGPAFYIIEEKFHHSSFAHYVLPGLLILFCGGFYVMLFFIGKGWGGVGGEGKSYAEMIDIATHQRMTSQGHWTFLLEERGEDAGHSRFLRSYIEMDFDLIRWEAIFNAEQMGNYIMLALLSALAILTNSSLIDEHTGKDIDFNQEIEVAGAANGLAACFGSLIGFASEPKTMLLKHQGGDHFGGAFIIIYFVGFYQWGFKLVRWIPVPVLA